MGFYTVAEQKIEAVATPTINWSLILIGALLILCALFVTNRWLKAAILAWIVLP